MAFTLLCLIVSMTTFVMAQGCGDKDNLDCEKYVVLEYVPPHCPPGWTMFRGECFKLYKEHKTWQESKDVCFSEEAHLAFVPDEETHQFVVKDFVSQDASQGIWLGLNDITVEGTFQWGDNTEGITYIKWSAGQPDNYDEEDCVGYTPYDPEYWNDFDCTVQLHFICQKTVPPQCPPGWTMFRGECFKLYKEHKTWQESRDACLCQEAHMAFVPDEETHQFVVKDFVSQDASQGIWLGLNDIKVEGTFQWGDNTEGITYIKWSAGQPDNYDEEDCVGYTPYDPEYWNDFDCTEQLHFICQKNAHR